MTVPSERVWSAGRPVDLAGTLAGPLCRGTADPAHRLVNGTFWWACTTPDGDGTLALRSSGSDVHASAWGPGASWLLGRVPTLLGAGDDWTALQLDERVKLREVLASVERFVVATPDVELLDVETAWLESERA